MPAATSYASPPSSPISRHGKPIKPLTRNVDEVLLGSVLFDTWYFSPYPDSIVLGTDPKLHHQQQPSTTTTTTTRTLHATPRFGPGHGAKSVNNAMKLEEDREVVSKNGGHVSCPRLHVCPRCFAYTPNALHYVTHLKHHCPLAHPAQNPQDRKGIPLSSVASDGNPAGIPPTAMKVYDYEGYAVWEVDGELEKLYCQNLSLFGKLFLEQKSVFFDVGSFLYYVLTYTPPPGTSVADASAQNSPMSTKTGTKKRKYGDASNTSGSTEDWIQAIHTGSQTLGFFSKEKLSWDSNNLACIVIFPPYQHRSLGKLLMSVSYKLSGWEWEGGVIGGPEKPLSTMGRKSYTRFWAERVARYLLGETRDADGRRILERSNAARKRGKKKVAKKKKKDVLTVKEIAERTGMLADDVVVALVEMGICDPVVKKGGKKASVNGEATRPSTAESDKEPSTNVAVKRSKVLEWVERHGVDVRDPVSEEGFLGEWALSDDSDDIEMDDDDDEDDGSDD